MRYFIDSEFIEDGKTIELISIALVAEDKRQLYLQNADCNFKLATDWVWRNVFPHLTHFSMSGERSCTAKRRVGSDPHNEGCRDPQCPWRSHFEIRDAVLDFLNPSAYGKPEVWGYYADYDWVAHAQLFGRMVDLPSGFPKYCRDLKQWADMMGNVPLPPKPVGEHNALTDALWNKQAFEFLTEQSKAVELRNKQTTEQDYHKLLQGKGILPESVHWIKS